MNLGNGGPKSQTLKTLHRRQSCRREISFPHQAGGSTMEKLLCSDLSPGVVVFGRVNSFPWWPAIVGRCPTTGEWSDKQNRSWVFFFNDKSGAWLKIRDMRPFTEWTRESMAEVNNVNPKYKKHLDTIARASVLAIEYMRAPVIPRPLSEYNVTLTYGAIDMQATEEAGETGGKRERDAVEEESNVEGRRPRRRRKKSTRLDGFNDPFEIDARNGRLKYGRRVRDNGKDDEIVGNGTDVEKKKVQKLLLTLPLNDRKGTGNILEWKERGRNIASVKNGELDEHVERTVTISRANPLKLRINGAAVSSARNGGKASESAVARVGDGVGLNNGMRNGGGMKEYSDDSETGEEVVCPSANDGIEHSGDTADEETTRGIGMRSNGEEDSVSSSIERDDEEDGGSLTDNATGAVDGEEDMYELNNRMRALEGHVQSLQMRIGNGENVVSGENSSAAALKAAVHNLARAARGFARSRGFENRTIGAGIDALWPLSPQCGGNRAHGEIDLVRSIAKSVVWSAAEIHGSDRI